MVKKDSKVNEYGPVITDDLVYFSLTPQRFEELSHEIPKIAINFSHEICRKLKSREERSSSLVSDNVKKRLINFFSDWANADGLEEDGQVMLRNYLTHNDIANLISTCRQTVTSLLNNLKNQGNIQYSRSWIVIPDLNQLRLNLNGNSLM
jgi:CRP/FNR family transcriptional regulator